MSLFTLILSRCAEINSSPHTSNLLSIREIFTIHFFIIIDFMETESISEVSGPHDMEAIEKKKIIISAY